MRERDSEGPRYPLRSRAVLPFFIPQGRRTPRRRSVVVISEPEVKGIPASHTEEASDNVSEAFPDHSMKATARSVAAPAAGSPFLQVCSASSESEVGSVTSSVPDEYDVMDLPPVVGGSRDNRFSGRPRTQTLRDFKAFVTSMISRYKFKHGQNYTALYMFEQLPR